MKINFVELLVIGFPASTCLHCQFHRIQAFM